MAGPYLGRLGAEEIAEALGESVSKRQRASLGSSAISDAEYDPETQQMELTFVNGGPYTFYNVPQDVYDGLGAAPSAGKYYHAFIKGRY